jgi:hypothetical protein
MRIPSASAYPRVSALFFDGNQRRRPSKLFDRGAAGPTRSGHFSLLYGFAKLLLTRADRGSRLQPPRSISAAVVTTTYIFGRQILFDGKALEEARRGPATRSAADPDQHPWSVLLLRDVPAPTPAPPMPADPHLQKSDSVSGYAGLPGP